MSRQIQRTRNHSGIDGVHMQGQTITERMGPIVDRTLEHVGSSDRMIMRARRRPAVPAGAHTGNERRYCPAASRISWRAARRMFCMPRLPSWHAYS